MFRACFVILSLLFTLSLEASMSPFFIVISDALSSVKSGDSKLAKYIMIKKKKDFNALNINTALSDDVKKR